MKHYAKKKELKRIRICKIIFGTAYKCKHHDNCSFLYLFYHAYRAESIIIDTMNRAEKKPNLRKLMLIMCVFMWCPFWQCLPKLVQSSQSRNVSCFSEINYIYSGSLRLRCFPVECDKRKKKIQNWILR